LFERAWPPAEWRDLHVVLAVSGGSDSVAMLRAGLAVKNRAGGRGKVHAAHLNHGLRGEQAAADQAWLESLCRQLAVPLGVGHVDVSSLAAQQGDGWEAAARSARYEFLRETAEQIGARWIAVGHTADDQVETVLHRLLRGTGIAGLAGMPAVRPLSPTVALTRPLLAARRSDVLEYLETLGQDYCRDATNDDPRFTRNRLRLQLLPQLRSEMSGDVDQAVLSLARQAGEWQAAIAKIGGELADRCVTLQPAGEAEAAAEVRVDCRPLAGQAPLVVGEVCKIAWTRAGWPLQAMGFDQWQQLARLAAGDDSGPLDLPGAIRCQRGDTAVILRPIGPHPRSIR
jgi:tRNA(Ile)-lysidine synthase